MIFFSENLPIINLAIVAKLALDSSSRGSRVRPVSRSPTSNFVGFSFSGDTFIRFSSGVKKHEITRFCAAALGYFGYHTSLSLLPAFNSRGIGLGVNGTSQVSG